MVALARQTLSVISVFGACNTSFVSFESDEQTTQRTLHPNESL